MVDENNTNTGEENFAEMMAAFDATPHREAKVGDKIKGKIISMDANTVFVDTGDKIDGVVEREELLDDEGNLPLAEGDEVELYVVARTPDQIKLSKALSGIGGLEMLQQAYDSSLPVEGKVRETCKGGFVVDVFKRRAFCPVSQIDTRFVEDTEPYVGQTFQFMITKLEERGRNVVVSRRILLEKEQAQAQETFMDTLAVGDEMEGKVSRLAPFGAFVEIAPGLDGMVHISELGWSRVAAPEDVLSQGETVRVKVMEIGQDKKGRPRISLSMKQLMADPWDTAAETFKPGQVVPGTVTRLAKFGAFVEIAPGVEGLVHVSEMSYLKRVHKPEDEVQPGDKVEVMVKDVDGEKRRIGLSLRDAAGDPWSGAADKYKPGTTVQGVVDKMEEFGLFINLEAGITGLMPKSLLKRAEDPSALESLKPGDAVTVMVQEIKPDDRRMTLAPADTKEPEDWKSFSKKEEPPMTGTLGAALSEALKTKK